MLKKKKNIKKSQWEADLEPVPPMPLVKLGGLTEKEKLKSTDI